MTPVDSGLLPPVEIFGRRASLYTRIALLFAEALHVPWRLTHIPDMTSLAAAAYGGNPALKLPVLRAGEGMVLGTENICRTLAAKAAQQRHVHVVWPDHLPDLLSRNAQELVWHCSNAQVQLAMGTILSGLPPENIYFVKARTGMQGALAWLDRNLDELVAALPPERELSLFEASLFCLMEHLVFRPTLAVAPYSRLNAFVDVFAKRDAARATIYRTEPP
ncbi:MAG: hypothetical protein M3Y79_14245 [Pseudomonadota bacterium]|nr:hypothetical protein [Pseudomonadota bacterium]